MNAPRLIASGFAAGLAPRAPGTAGSLVGLLLGVWVLHAAGPVGLIGAIILASIAGLWAIPRAADEQADPGWVVIDEIAGQMIALLAVPHPGLWQMALAFALFRLFDITKWGPIGWADRRHDALGIMADDWIAGLFAALALILIVSITTYV